MDQATREDLKKTNEGLTQLLRALQSFQADLEEIKSAEEEKFNNLSEGLQQSENGQNMEAAVTELGEAFDKLGEAESAIDEAMGCIANVAG